MDRLQIGVFLKPEGFDFWDRAMYDPEFLEQLEGTEEEEDNENNEEEKEEEKEEK